MTENEAINVMEKYTDITLSKVVIEAHNMAIEALEEVQQYREIEKRLENMFGGQLPLKRYVDQLEEALAEPDKPHPVNARILTYEDADMWEAYKSIGTVEEFKALKEKSVAKKPRTIVDAMICPNCSKVYAVSTGNYCMNCGQKLDWE